MDHKRISKSPDYLTVLEKTEETMQDVKTEVYELSPPSGSKKIIIPEEMLLQDLTRVELEAKRRVTSREVGDTKRVCASLETGRYIITMGGQCVLETGIKMGQNLLPTRDILPIKSGLYATNMGFLMDFDNVPDDIWGSISHFEVRVEGTRNAIEAHMGSVAGSIRWDDQYLRFSDGTASLEWHAYGITDGRWERVIRYRCA